MSIDRERVLNEIIGVALRVNLSSTCRDDLLLFNRRGFFLNCPRLIRRRHVTRVSMAVDETSRFDVFFLCFVFFGIGR